MKENIKVLLFEDDDDYALIIKEKLKESGGPRFTLERCDRLEPGLVLLREGGVDVVLLDLMLPDSQGLATLRRARVRPDVPIVVITSLDDEATGVAAVQEGAQDYIVKGAASGALLKRSLRYAIERGRMAADMERILERAPDAMLVVQEGGMIRYANPAAICLFGKTSEDLIGRPFEYAVDAGKTVEISFPTRQGQKSAEMRCAEVLWRGGSAFLLMMRDITELKRVEQLRAEIKERRRMDQLKDQFMGAVSHELRSPLTIIKAAVGNLREGLAGPLSESQAVMVGLAHRNIDRLARLLNNILDLSRLESGMAKINRRRVNAGRILKDAVQGYELASRDRGIGLSVEVPPDLPAVYADEDMLAQVVSNLLDNALRFARGQVRLEAREVEGAGVPVRAGSGRPAPRAVQISVMDDGMGIVEENMQKLFKKFVQLERQAGGSGYKGTGLGLSLCKEIVDRNEGRIWAESRVGEGTRFHFTLPQYAE